MNGSGGERSRTIAGETPTDLGAEATRSISAVLNTLLADMFALYMKTKNFHWHMWGAHFRDFHLLLDDQAEKIYAVTDVMAERVRKIGAPTLRSIGDISRQQRVQDNDSKSLTPFQMLAELREDNLQLAAYLREAHSVCGEQGDVASAGLLETWIDEAEQRVWFLFEACRYAEEPAS
jgi:starvation-inducible DNA-binding protein